MRAEPYIHNIWYPTGYFSTIRHTNICLIAGKLYLVYPYKTVEVTHLE